MARASRVEECMICGELPCVCGKPRKTSKPKSKPKPVVETVSKVEPRSMRDAMKATAIAKPVVRPIHQVHAKPETPISDLLLADALKNLTPILHPDALKEHSALINQEFSTTERTAVWKARRSLEES